MCVAAGAVNRAFGPNVVTVLLLLAAAGYSLAMIILTVIRKEDY